MQGTKVVPNQFAVDYQAGGTVIDINNPPHRRYQHQEYPKMLYSDAKTKVVKDAAEEQKLIAAGWSSRPMNTARVEESVVETQPELDDEPEITATPEPVKKSAPAKSKKK